MKKRFISALIAATMALSAMPMAFADGETAANNTYTVSTDGKTGVTNVGKDSIGLIEVTGLDADENVIKLYVGDTEIENFETTATDNGFTIDPMYFSTWDDGVSKKSIYPTTETECKIVINGEEHTFTSSLIVPLAHKDGKKIINVAEGVVPNLRETSVGTDGSTIYMAENKNDRGNREVVTDGRVFADDWNNVFSPRWVKDLTASTLTEVGSQTDRTIFTLDLGKKYEIVGAVLVPNEKSDSGNYGYKVGADNNEKTEKIGVTILGLARNNESNLKTKTSKEVLTNFSINETSGFENVENNYQYIHFGTLGEAKGSDISELMVYAYVDDDATLTVKSNVDGKTVTNVGTDGTDMIEVNCGRSVSKNQIKLYVGEKEVTDFAVTSTQNGFKVDPMFFSTMTGGDTKNNIYPTGTTECRIVISTSVGSGEVTFKGSEILPIAHMDGSKIVNVARNATITLAENLKENPNNRGTKEVINDGVLYDPDNGWCFFSPNWNSKKGADNDWGYKDTTVFTMDLGSEYNIAGIAIAGAYKNSGNNRNYAVQLDNVSNTETLSSKYIDTVLGAGWNYSSDCQITDQVVTKFAESTARYLHIGSNHNNRGGVDISELMVYAYVPVATVETELVPVGNQTVTNVGTDVTDYVKLAIKDDDVKLGDSIAVTVTAANGAESTVTASKIANENAYKIETKDFSGLKTDNAVQNFSKSGTATVKFENVMVGGKSYSGSATVNTGHIVPVAYKAGKYIIDVAAGKGVYMPYGASNGTTPYEGNWTGMFTDGNSRTNLSVKKPIVTENTCDNTKPALKLDLGAAYDIVGVAQVGRDSGHHETRYQKIVLSNEADLTTYDNITGYATTPGTNTVENTQVMSKFDENTQNAQYVYVGGNYGTYVAVTFSDISVYAYVDATAPTMYVANSADGGIKAGTYYTGSASVILGKYNESGLDSVVISDTDKTAEIARTSGFTYKAFLWESLTSIKALTNAVDCN